MRTVIAPHGYFENRPDDAGGRSINRAHLRPRLRNCIILLRSLAARAGERFFFHSCFELSELFSFFTASSRIFHPHSDWLCARHTGCKKKKKFTNGSVPKEELPWSNQCWRVIGVAAALGVAGSTSSTYLIVVRNMRR